MKLSKKNKVAILKRAREIIADKKHWTRGRLRKKERGVYRYCLTGACEQAVYDLGLAEPNATAFAERGPDPNTMPFGYQLTKDLSLFDHARETRMYATPWSINDVYGHQAALDLLDGYGTKLKKRPAKKGN